MVALEVIAVIALFSGVLAAILIEMNNLMLKRGQVRMPFWPSLVLFAVAFIAIGLDKMVARGLTKALWASISP